MNFLLFILFTIKFARVDCQLNNSINVIELNKFDSKVFDSPPPRGIIKGVDPKTNLSTRWPNNTVVYSFNLSKKNCNEA